MNLKKNTIFVLCPFVLSGCMVFQSLTLDNQFDEEHKNISQDKPVKLVHIIMPKNKKDLRKLIYDKSVTFKRQWYSCDNENIKISLMKQGAVINFRQVINGCFGYHFPSADIRNHSILALKAELPKGVKQDMFDFTVGLVDDSRKSIVYKKPIYLDYDHKKKFYFFDLRDFILENHDMNADRIQSISFHLNIIGTDPAEGEIIISHIEFLKSE